MKKLQTSDDYVKCITKNKRVVIFYGAAWCKACTDLKPIYKRIAKRYEKRVTLVYCDIDNTELKFERIPVFVSVYKGQVVNQVIGADEESLKEFIAELINNK